MAGNVTGFQRPYQFEANATHKTVGVQQGVTYGSTMRKVQVPEADNAKCVGVVTYQFQDREEGHVAVQLDRIVEMTAVGTVNFGDDVIMAAGGGCKATTHADVTVGTVMNVVGEAQNSAADGEPVQVLVRPKVYTKA